MEKCSVVNCDYSYFEQEDKCVLHCEKDEKNGWYTFNNSNKKEWNPEKVKLFWEKADDGVDDIPHKSKIPPLLNHNLTYNLDIFDCDILDDFKLTAIQSQKHPSITITLTTLYGKLLINMHYGQQNNDIQISLLDNKHQDMIKIQGSANFDLFFSNIDVGIIDLSSRDKENLVNRYSKIEIRNNNSEYKIKKLHLKNVVVYGKFTMNKVDLDYFNCSGSVFEKKVEIKESIFNKTSFFKNTKFNSLCDFYKTKFHCNNFTKTTFEDIVVFTESEFYEDVNFKYTTFEKLALFRKTIFEKTVNFEDAIFKEEANFLDMNANMANRETARIIKNSFEQQNNIIEANRFYAREMKKREEELEKDIKNKEKRDLKTFIDYIIFKLHGVSSNHSQDPISPIIWMFSISFFYLTIIQINFQDYSFENWMYYHSVNIMGILITLALFYKKCGISHICKILYVGVLQLYYLKFISDCSYASLFNTVADKINPTSEEPITFGLLMFKITIAYLIYQFIVSVRQNTRRK